MAAKLSFSLTLVLHVLLLLYTGQLHVISSKRDERSLIDQAQEKLNDMTLSMRKSGYGLSASILQFNLKRFIHECGFMRSNITIFAPRDEGMNSFMPSFPVQILIQRIEEEDFWSDRIVKGTYLNPGCEPWTTVNVTEHPKFYPGRLSIGNARVLHWSIYQDDVTVVHGVDSFFDGTSICCVFREDTYLLPWIIPWESDPLLPGWTFERLYGNLNLSI